MKLKLYHIITLAAVTIVTSACTPKSSPKPGPVLHVFRDSVGGEFNYSAPITVSNNPHGAAGRAAFLIGGSPIGGVTLCPPPPTSAEVLMADVIIRATMKNYGATRVLHTKLTNSQGCVFHRFTADACQSGIDYNYALFLYVEKRKFENPAQALLVEKLGTRKFEFMVPQSKFESISNHIETIIDSFKPSPDWGKMPSSP